MCGEGGGGHGALSGNVREMMGMRTMEVGCVMQEERCHAAGGLCRIPGGSIRRSGRKKGAWPHCHQMGCMRRLVRVGARINL